MDTQRLLRELARQDIVPKAVLDKLESKLADKSDIPSPRSVAKFLVDKGHLTVAQAKKALRAILTPEESAILDATPISADEDGLPSLSGVNLPSSGGVDSLTGPDLGGDTSEPKSKKKSKGKKRAKGQSQWDSPLILLGGGGLILLLLIGGTILFLLNYESADERFKNAQEAYDQGSYPQAIADFETYLEKHQGHPDNSMARVRLGTARIRMATDVKGNFEEALDVAKEEADAIEDEERYQEAQAELNALLPQIAARLSEKADAATDIQAMQRYIRLTEESLALCQNTKLIPGRLRDDGELNAIREVLLRIGQRQTALENLRDTLKTMNDASAAGEPREAYAAHAAFVKAHPELAQDERVIEAVAAAAAAEESLVKFVADARPGLTDEPDSPVVAELAVAVPRVEAVAPAEGVSAFRLAGGLYGVSAKDGKLLWRRAVGAAGVPLSPTKIGDDWLTVDAKRKELVRLKGADGALVWRAPLDDDLAQPVVVGDRVFCAGLSGKLHVVEAGSGNTIGYIKFAQPLRTAPAVSEDGKTIYLTGEHSSFYSLSADDYSCLGVYYLGHSKGSIFSAPVSVQGRVMVFENDGAATSSLHVLGVDEQGAADRSLKTQRLNGLVNQSPDVFARRFAVLTDSGQVDVFEVSADDDQQPIVLLASRQPTRARRGPRYGKVVGSDLWLSDIGLAKYSIAPAGNRLPVREVADPFRGDSFIHPLEVIDGVLVHARKRRGKPGVTIGATDLRNGKSYWQTDLAAPGAGAPVSQASDNAILYATSGGRVFQLDQPKSRYTVSNRPLAESSEGLAPIFESAGVGADGSAVYWDDTQGLASSTSFGAATAPTFQLPGPIAVEPVRLGQGWIVPLALGQVHYVNAVDGAPLAAPFQPVLEPGDTRAWSTPGVTDNKVVIADGRSIYALELVSNKPARLEEFSRIEASGVDAVASRIAMAADQAFFARRDGRLTALAAGSLELAGEVDLGALVLWGPYAIEDKVLVATGAGELICVTAEAPDQIAWRVKIAADLVGPPLTQEGAFSVARRSGELLTKDLASGEAVGAMDVGQRLASGPVGYGAGLMFSTPDGALVLTKKP